MAMKDWKKDWRIRKWGKRRGTSFFNKYNPNEFIAIYLDDYDVPVFKLENSSLAGIVNQKILKFKTYIEARKFAKQYMRTH